MPTIKRFEDIQAWQKAREFTKVIYNVTGNGAFAKDFILKDQIKRAAISIMLNIAEGFGRRTDKEFNQFLVQAHGSCAEVQSALYIALDQSYIPENRFNDLYGSADEISRMVTGFYNYLAKKKTASNPLCNSFDSLDPSDPLDS
jgi:four helix bundle protein